MAQYRANRMAGARALCVGRPVLRASGFGQSVKGDSVKPAERKANDGAPGIDGVTFDAIEAAGVEGFLAQLRDELVTIGYRPQRNRQRAIPKEGTTKVRILSIPAIRDRVVQGALKLILGPIFEADCQPGSCGYRPKRTAHAAVKLVADAIVRHKTHIIDLDLKAYVDNVRHDRLLEKVAARVNDDEVLHVLKMMLKAAGEKGVPQGGVISPLLSNLFLNEVDRMLERAKTVTRDGRYTAVEYARFADDLVILVDAHPRHAWVLPAVEKRLREELASLGVDVNEEKTRIVDLTTGASFGFLGFDFRRVRSLNGAWRPQYTPKLNKRTALLRTLNVIFGRSRSQPVRELIQHINPILRGWVNYFAVGHAGRCFSFVRDWVEKKVRRHLMRNTKRGDFGWRRWRRAWLANTLGLFAGYQVRYRGATGVPARCVS